MNVYIFKSTAASSPKPITTCCSVLPSEIVMHDAYIGGRSRLRNDPYCVEWDVKLYYTIPSADVQRVNALCMTIDDLGWKNQTTLYILPRHWLYE